MVKNGLIFKNKETAESINPESGLTYNTVTIEDLVNKDTDGDGVPDWEEVLWGTDPTKKETTPGIPDSVAIDKLKAKEENGGDTNGTNGTNAEHLTETDKFSRELFSTIAATSQSGSLDQATIDQISGSLADHIKNSPQKRMFSVSEIKIIKSDTVQTFTNYNNALNDIYKKYPAPDYTIMDVLQQFIIDQNNVDTSALVKLDPIIKQTNQIKEAMRKIGVPQSLTVLHLNVINSLEMLVENLNDIRLYDSDSVVALGGISKYEATATQLDLSLNNLANAINKKLKN